MPCRTEWALDKRFVYVLRSGSTPTRYYTGLTSDVAARLAAHNAGHSTHTAAGLVRRGRVLHGAERRGFDGAEPSATLDHVTATTDSAPLSGCLCGAM